MKVKKKLIVMLAAVMALTAIPVGPLSVVEAKESWKLSAKSVSISTGTSKKIAIKNATKKQLKKAKWKIVKGKNVISLKVSKKNSKATVTAKAAGSAKISVTIGKTKKTCVVKVKKTSAGYPEKVTDTALTMLTGLRSAQKDPSNTLISPDSILSCLTMVGNGADGATLDEMKKVFGVDDMADYSSFWKNEHDRLTSVNSDKDGKVSYNVANSIWANSDQITLSEDYIKANKADFGAELYNAKFSDTTVKDINSWVNKNTKSMIPTIIDKLEKDDVAVLLNALAFEGQWAVQYQDYQVDKNGSFTTAAGKKQTVNMLSGTEGDFLELNGAKGFIKPYSNGDFAFFAYLPKEGTSVDKFLSTVSGEEFIKAYKNRKSTDVVTKMPEFSYDYSTSLKDQLKKMGMELSFSNDADLTKMQDFKKDPLQSRLKISDVIHKTHIEVDRNGTKAAAVTAAIIEKATSVPDRPEPEYVTLDRPFVYGILDTQTGMPLFIGTVDSVK